MNIDKLIQRAAMYHKAEDLILEVVCENKDAETINHFDLFIECMKHIGSEDMSINKMQELVHKTKLSPIAVERARRHLADKGRLKPLRGGKECEEIDRYVNGRG